MGFRKLQYKDCGDGIVRTTPVRAVKSQNGREGSRRCSASIRKASGQTFY